jgi:hypothetical protein
MKLFTVLLSGAAIVACLVLTGAKRADADTLQMTQCADFSSAAWVSPYPPSESSTKYSLGLMQHDLSCAQALAWAKKLLVQHLTPPADDPLKAMPLRGGPPGYACTASADKNGHAYQGSCKKASKDLFNPAFHWGVAK